MKDMKVFISAQGTHPVWEILDRNKYTEVGQKEMERIYEFLCVMQDAVGETTMKQLHNFWNEYSGETFLILEELTQEQSK